jgi:hypothetical protein
MSLNPKAFIGLPPSPPSNPRLSLPPPPSPPPKFTPVMIQVPPQPTLRDVMIALGTLNENIAQLSNQIDYIFKCQTNSDYYIAKTILNFVDPTLKNTNWLVGWAGGGVGGLVRQVQGAVTGKG